MREIEVLKLLNHPNIVKLLEVLWSDDTLEVDVSPFGHSAESEYTTIATRPVQPHTVEESMKSKKIFLVLELVPGGEVFDMIISRGRLDEGEARKLFRQIISGMQYCHAHLVCHRDLKPENLLLDADGNIKITDFGLSNMVEPGKLFDTFCGSPIYAPPEIVLKQAYIGHKVDIWSLGIILYVLVTGGLPWRLEKNCVVHNLQDMLEGKFCIPSELSHECAHLLRRMVVADSDARASLEEVVLHPWTNRGYTSPPKSLLEKREPVRYVDEVLLDQVVLLGFDREEARASILANSASPELTAYFLLRDRRERQAKVQREREPDGASVSSPPVSPANRHRRARSDVPPRNPIPQHWKTQLPGEGESSSQEQIQEAGRDRANTLPVTRAERDSKAAASSGAVSPRTSKLNATKHAIVGLIKKLRGKKSNNSNRNSSEEVQVEVTTANTSSPIPVSEDSKGKRTSVKVSTTQRSARNSVRLSFKISSPPALRVR